MKNKAVAAKFHDGNPYQWGQEPCHGGNATLFPLMRVFCFGEDMYGKIFEQIYDGTLREEPITRLVFMDMIILADRDGIVDMTHEALSARTNVPVEKIYKSIERLEAPDLRSRSADESGARIVRIDEHRDWGWKLVNYEFYLKKGSYEDKKEKDRKRIAEKRNKNKGVAKSRKESHEIAKVAHIDIDKDIDKDKRKKYKRKKSYSGDFLRFYQNYPKHTDKAEAFLVWKNLDGNRPDTDELIAAVNNQKAHKEHLVNTNQFCPEWKSPARWLRRKCWEDECVFEEPAKSLTPIQRKRKQLEMERIKREQSNKVDV